MVGVRVVVRVDVKVGELVGLGVVVNVGVLVMVGVGVSVKVFEGIGVKAQAVILKLSKCMTSGGLRKSA